MPNSPPLLVDTSSLLRAQLDRFDGPLVNNSHAYTVIESLILFDHILLDGPSVERNSASLQWLSDIDDGIEILDISAGEQTALYRSAEVLARQMCPSPAAWHFMGGHIPRELACEIAPEWAQTSTNWYDLKRSMKSEDLRRLQEVFEQVLGPAAPHSSGAFAALTRALYYLCLQESVRSSLLLDPLKRLEADSLDTPGPAGHVLDFFDQEVGEAFRERKRKWLGDQPRKFRLPLLANFVSNEARRRGWSIGRIIVWMRQSREVELFRDGLNELQDALDDNDAASLDAVFSGLDAAAAAWSKRLGAGYRHSDVSVSVSLPFVGIAKNLPLPRLARRSTSDKLLVFIRQLLAGAE